MPLNPRLTVLQFCQADFKDGKHWFHRAIQRRGSHRRACASKVHYHLNYTDDRSVVAVHGLNGDPLRTWTVEASGKMWLKEPGLLPSNLKDSRILTYGYDAAVTSIFGKASSDRILQHAQTLVAELVADREVYTKNQQHCQE